MDATILNISANRSIYKLILITTTLLIVALPFSSLASDSDAKSLTDCTQLDKSLNVLLDPNASNHCPRANAGIDEKIILGNTISLNGSASSDWDGQRLKFRWSLVKSPTGSTTKIVNANSFLAKFTADLGGDYIFALTVIDTTGAVSVDTVRYSTGNIAPIANAGPDISSQLDELYLLDASRSYDTNNDRLSYQWRVVARPPNSRSLIDSSGQSRAALNIDAAGDYLIELVVSDGKLESVADTLNISTQNTRPIAHVKLKRPLAPNSTLVLDGRLSTDPDGSALAYHWSILSAPKNSNIKLSNADTLSPGAQVDLEGLYLFQLLVDDGQLVSAASTVLVEVKRDSLANLNPQDYLHLSNRAGNDDSDGDGVPDAQDNCVLVGNTQQRDTDGDGIGNFCDPDLNNDGIVNFSDLSIFAGHFLSDNPDADFDGSGVVNFVDVAIYSNYVLQPPGPVGTLVWSSLVDGDWNNRLNWFPQLVPGADSIAIIDVATDVVVYMSSDNTSVKALVQNESLVMNGTTFTALNAVELGGVITGSATTINNTSFVPSTVGSGTVVLNGGAHTWNGNYLGVDTLLKQTAVITNSNGLTVDATLTIDAPTGITGIEFVNTQSLAGSGTIIFATAGNQLTNARLRPSPDTTLTLGTGLTVRGATGQIGHTLGNLVLNADVASDVDTERMYITAKNISGTGALRALNGGHIIFDGKFENAGNAFTMDTVGGTLKFSATSEVRNATFNGTEGSVLDFGGVHIENLILNVDIFASNVFIDGDLTLNGEAHITNAMSFRSPATFSGTGTVLLDGGSVYTVNSNYPLIVGPDITIRGWGSVGKADAANQFNGVITPDTANQSLLIQGDPWTTANDLTTINGGELRLGGNINDNGGNPLTLNANGGTVSLVDGFELSNTTINCASGTDLTFDGGTSTIQGALTNCDINMLNDVTPVLNEVTVTGNIGLLDGAIATIKNGLTLDGTMLITSSTNPTGLNFQSSQTLAGNATIVLDGRANDQITETRIYADGAFSFLTIAPTVTICGGNFTIEKVDGSIRNQGTISADLGSIDLSGREIINSGTLQAQNTHTLQIENLSPGVGDLHVGAGSTISIAMAESLVFSATDNVSIDISGPNLVGQIIANRPVTYTGSLSISAVDGYLPTVSDTFAIFSHPDSTGMFDNVNSIGLPPGQSFDVLINATDVTATVVQN